MVSVVRYTIRRGKGGDCKEDVDIKLNFWSHAILYALFEILIERGIEFRILNVKEEI